MSHPPSTTHGQPARCAVCDDAIPFADTLLQQGKPMQVCRNFDCRRLLNLQTTTPPALFKAQFDFQRKRIREQREKEHTRKQHIDTINAEEAEQDRRLLQQYLDTHPEQDASQIETLAIPTGRAVLTPLSEQRIQAYTEHLQTIIRQAAEHNDANDIPSDQHHDAHTKRIQIETLLEQQPDLKQISDTLCTQCKGGCCSEGGNHAYLAAITIRRQMDAEPDLTEQDMLQRYRHYIATESAENACINQTANGCALPRHLRSDVCNSFYCEPLHQLHTSWPARKPDHALLVIQRSNTHWNRFDDENGNTVTGTLRLNLADLMNRHHNRERE